MGVSLRSLTTMVDTLKEEDLMFTIGVQPVKPPGLCVTNQNLSLNLNQNQNQKVKLGADTRTVSCTAMREHPSTLWKKHKKPVWRIPSVMVSLRSLTTMVDTLKEEDLMFTIGVQPVKPPGLCVTNQNQNQNLNPNQNRK